MPLLAPIARALGQLDDRVFIGVVWRSVAWSILGFILLHLLVLWGLHQIVSLDGWVGWVLEFAGSIAATLITAWLFLPLAAGIGMLYLERIAQAVEARHFPWMPPPAGESLWLQAWDGVVVGLKVLALNLLALLLALLLPGIGWILGWAIGAYAIGRGLFVAVAMRRMPRPAAESVYAANRPMVLAQGAILALSAYIPILNLLIPVIGTAAMVHVLDHAMSRRQPPAGPAISLINRNR